MKVLQYLARVRKSIFLALPCFKGENYWKKIFLLWEIIFFSVWFSRGISLRAPTLQQLFSYQNKFNPQLSAKRSEVKKSISEYEKALKSYFPDLKLNLSGQRRRNVYRSSASSQYSHLLNFSSQRYYQTLWSYNVSLGGVLYNKGIDLYIKKYLYLKDIAQLMLEKTKRNLLFQLLQGYLVVLKNKALWEQEEDNLKLTHLQYALVKAKYAAGMNLKTDILRAKLQVSEEEDKVIVARNNYYVSILELEKTIGKYGIFQHKRYYFENKWFFHFLENSLRQLKKKMSFSDRVDYLILLRKYQLARLDAQIKKSEYFPAASYSFSYQKSDDKFFPEKNSVLMASVNFAYDILDFGKKNKALWGLIYKKKSYQAQLQDLKHQIEYQLRAGWLKLEELRSRVKILKEACQVSEESYTLLTERYKNGLATILDLTDGEVKRNQTKTNYITIKYNYYLEAIKYLYAKGKLWNMFRKSKISKISKRRKGKVSEK